jgi:pyruvate, orthophosphate dikinase
MQARAIFEAACDVPQRNRRGPVPEVMIPLVATRRELEILRALVDRVAAEVFAEKGRTLEYLVGTMIELPRAALMAGEIAEEAEFFSLRHQRPDPDDAGRQPRRCRRVPQRLCRAGHLPRDPFVSLDIEGVGQLVELAASAGGRPGPTSSSASAANMAAIRPRSRSARRSGLDYVSASPYRVPIARLAAAQAALAVRARPSPVRVSGGGGSARTLLRPCARRSSTSLSKLR